MKEHAARIKKMLCLKSQIKNHRNDQQGILAQPARYRPNQLSYLAGRFYGHQSRISDKTFSESLMHTLSSHEGPIESFFNFIQISLSVLWFFLKDKKSVPIYVADLVFLKIGQKIVQTHYCAVQYQKCDNVWGKMYNSMCTQQQIQNAALAQWGPFPTFITF